MSQFLNLDETTRLNMIAEFELDEKVGLLYPPKTLQPAFRPSYWSALKHSLWYGTPDSLQKALPPLFFREKDKSGRKTPYNAKEVLAFSDFNRYYCRAILVRAIDENKCVYVYRAKEAQNIRSDSKSLLQTCYANENALKQLLHTMRNYHLLFSSNSNVPFMRPNSWLSLRLG